jgi:hypothetical protein
MEHHPGTVRGRQGSTGIGPTNNVLGIYLSLRSLEPVIFIEVDENSYFYAALETVISVRARK